jgi:hypothetical protein
MRYMTAAAIAALAIFGTLLAAEPADPLAAKKAAMHEALASLKFQFTEGQSGVITSLRQCDGDVRIHLIYDPKDWGKLTFKFERDGKEVLSLYGHTASSFFICDHVLYFAHFSACSTGCAVAAYDLTTGKTVWKTRLSAVRPGWHSAYSNKVAMELVGSKGEGVITVIGREAYGDYIEILDMLTGKVLAQRVYREGF